jgi:hypothetical protein
MKEWLREKRARGTRRRAGALLALTIAVVAIAGSAHAASTARCSNGCKLVFTVQPTNAVVGDQITGAAFSVQTSTAAASVEVTVEDNAGNPIKNATGTVSLSKLGGTFDTPPCNSFLNNATNAALSQGVATFGSLSASCTGSLFTARATSTSGYTNATSQTFSIFAQYVPCDTIKNPTCKATQDLGGGGDSGLSTETSNGTFTFVALAATALDPKNLPAGCDNWQSVGTNGFRETDTGTGTGTKTFRYFVSQGLIKARYGKNTGQQFIPICAGGMREVNGTPVPCNQDTNPGGGWWGESLDPTTHNFTGVLVQATCNADGLWWGILSSFQDVNNNNFGNVGAAPPSGFSWSTNPLVTSWNSCTGGQAGCPGTAGTTYRYFSISVPPPWDWGGNA